MSFKLVELFEEKIANFYGSNYAVATDCCTHSIELCLRYLKIQKTACPTHTYLSIPFTLSKLGINWCWRNNEWTDYYYLSGTPIIDAAVYFKEGGYISGTHMCVSFQFKKPLSLGRGGAILCDNYQDYVSLKKMSYDGRFGDEPWSKQDIDTIGYHYYMTPETAQLGLEKLPNAHLRNTKKWTWRDYPFLPEFKVFQ